MVSSIEQPQAAQPADARLAAEQVQLVYGQVHVAMLGTSICALVTTAVLWSEVNHGLLLGWLGANLLVAALRVLLGWRYRRDVSGAESAARWRRLYYLGVAVSGILWGLGGVALFPPHSIDHQVFLIFMAGGLAAGSVATYAALPGMAATFFVPALVPVTVRFFLQDGTVALSMGGMGLVYMLMIALAARNVHRTTVESLKLRLENLGLIDFLTEAKGSAEKLNAQLKAEIDEHALADQALRDSEEKFRALVENAADGIVLTVEDRIVYANQATCDNFGYTQEELYSRPITAFMAESPTGREQIYDRYQQRLAGKEVPPQNEGQLLRRDGSVVDVLLSSSAVRLGKEVGVITMIKDITEMKRVERLKNEFVSIVSHELRTPLTSIHGSLGLLASGAVGELPAEADTLVQVAAQSSDRLVRLTNDILDLDKMESGKMPFESRALEITALVEQAIAANMAFGERYGVTFELAERLNGVRVNADSDRLIQVLDNLLSNAAKYSTPKEKVKVSLSRRADGTVRVAVSNRGAGIPDAFRKQVFQKFAQADTSDSRQKAGTGLGLSIAKNIVEKMGGKIGFDSVPNETTTFYFDLPELPAT